MAEPSPKQIGTPDPALHAEAVSFESAGAMLHGWLLPAPDRSRQPAAVAVLAHGIGGDRRAMIGRALFLRRLGHASLVFDLRAHGESEGDAKTFGYLESQDVRAAVRWVRGRFRGSKVLVVGQSLGGAASLIGEEALDADALILESVYATLHEAITNRMHAAAGFLGSCTAPLLTLQSWFRLGVGVDACRPIDGIARFDGAVLVIGGAEDQHTPAAESRRLFEAAHGPKQLWLVEGLGHEDYWGLAREQYEQIVAGFLERHL